MVGPCRTWALLVAGLCCLLSRPVYAEPSREIAADRPAPLELGRAVRVVVCNPSLPPWVMESAGIASGVDLDLARELLAMLDASWTVEALSVEDAEARIYTQAADMFLCRRIPTAEGADKGDYTTPYAMLSVALVQRADDQFLGAAQILQVVFQPAALHPAPQRKSLAARLRVHGTREGEFFIDNLLVRIHLIIEMILVDRPCAMGV